MAWYELKERLLVPESIPKAEIVCNCDNEDIGLWGQILVHLDNNEKWRDPNLSLSTLSELLESNRTYVGEAFKRNTGITFVKYLTKRRIDYKDTKKASTIIYPLKSHNHNAHKIDLNMLKTHKK